MGYRRPLFRLTVINFADKAAIGIAAVPIMRALSSVRAGLGWSVELLSTVRGLGGFDGGFLVIRSAIGVAGPSPAPGTMRQATGVANPVVP
jgi:hypothetical protein